MRDIQLRAGSEPITGTDATIADFWRWAFSDLVLDTTRGKFAEFLVAWLIDEGHNPPPESTEYDIESAKRRIEVKSSAYRH